MDNEALRELLSRACSLGEIPAADLEAAAAVIGGADNSVLPPELSQEDMPATINDRAGGREVEGSQSAEEYSDPRLLISQATIPQKIKLALLGNALCRAILIRDTTRIIPLFVLRNPRLQPREVEEFAKSRDICETVIRAIAEHPIWMRSYNLKLAIVTNPKTPGDLALKWLRYLTTADLKKLGRSKNVPELVAVTARKRLAAMEKE